MFVRFPSFDRAIRHPFGMNLAVALLAIFALSACGGGGGGGGGGASGGASSSAVPTLDFTAEELAAEVETQYVAAVAKTKYAELQGKLAGVDGEEDEGDEGENALGILNPQAGADLFGSGGITATELAATAGPRLIIPLGDKPSGSGSEENGLFSEAQPVGQNQSPTPAPVATSFKDFSPAAKGKVRFVFGIDKDRQSVDENSYDCTGIEMQCIGLPYSLTLTGGDKIEGTKLIASLAYRTFRRAYVSGKARDPDFESADLFPLSNTCTESLTGAGTGLGRLDLGCLATGKWQLTAYDRCMRSGGNSVNCFAHAFPESGRVGSNNAEFAFGSGRGVEEEGTRDFIARRKGWLFTGFDDTAIGTFDGIDNGDFDVETGAFAPKDVADRSVTDSLRRAYDINRQNTGLLSVVERNKDHFSAEHAGAYRRGGRTGLDTLVYIPATGDPFAASGTNGITSADLQHGLPLLLPTGDGSNVADDEISPIAATFSSAAFKGSLSDANFAAAKNKVRFFYGLNNTLDGRHPNSYGCKGIKEQCIGLPYSFRIGSDIKTGTIWSGAIAYYTYLLTWERMAAADPANGTASSWDALFARGDRCTRDLNPKTTGADDATGLGRLDLGCMAQGLAPLKTYRAQLPAGPQKPLSAVRNFYEDTEGRLGTRFSHNGTPFIEGLARDVNGNILPTDTTFDCPEGRSCRVFADIHGVSEDVADVEDAVAQIYILSESDNNTPNDFTDDIWYEVSDFDSESKQLTLAVYQTIDECLKNSLAGGDSVDCFKREFSRSERLVRFRNTMPRRTGDIFTGFGTDTVGSLFNGDPIANLVAYNRHRFDINDYTGADTKLLNLVEANRDKTNSGFDANHTAAFYNSYGTAEATFRNSTNTLAYIPATADPFAVNQFAGITPTDLHDSLALLLPTGDRAAGAPALTDATPSPIAATFSSRAFQRGLSSTARNKVRFIYGLNNTLTSRHADSYGCKGIESQCIGLPYSFRIGSELKTGTIWSAATAYYVYNVTWELMRYADPRGTASSWSHLLARGDRCTTGLNGAGTGLGRLDFGCMAEGLPLLPFFTAQLPAAGPVRPSLGNRVRALDTVRTLANLPSTYAESYYEEDIDGDGELTNTFEVTCPDSRACRVFSIYKGDSDSGKGRLYVLSESSNNTPNDFTDDTWYEVVSSTPKIVDDGSADGSEIHVLGLARWETSYDTCMRRRLVVGDSVDCFAHVFPEWGRLTRNDDDYLARRSGPVFTGFDASATGTDSRGDSVADTTTYGWRRTPFDIDTEPLFDLVEDNRDNFDAGNAASGYRSYIGSPRRNSSNTLAYIPATGDPFVVSGTDGITSANLIDSLPLLLPTGDRAPGGSALTDNTPSPIATTFITDAFKGGLSDADFAGAKNQVRFIYGLNDELNDRHADSYGCKGIERYCIGLPYSFRIGSELKTGTIWSGAIAHYIYLLTWERMAAADPDNSDSDDEDLFARGDACARRLVGAGTGLGRLDLGCMARGLAELGTFRGSLAAGPQNPLNVNKGDFLNGLFGRRTPAETLETAVENDVNRDLNGDGDKLDTVSYTCPNRRSCRAFAVSTGGVERLYILAESDNSTPNDFTDDTWYEVESIDGTTNVATLAEWGAPPSVAAGGGTPAPLPTASNGEPQGGALAFGEKSPEAQAAHDAFIRGVYGPVIGRLSLPGSTDLGIAVSVPGDTLSGTYRPSEGLTSAYNPSAAPELALLPLFGASTQKDADSFSFGAVIGNNGETGAGVRRGRAMLSFGFMRADDFFGGTGEGGFAFGKTEKVRTAFTFNATESVRLEAWSTQAQARGTGRLLHSLSGTEQGARITLRRAFGERTSATLSGRVSRFVGGDIQLRSGARYEIGKSETATGVEFGLRRSFQ